ncbi:MAG: aminopeptidase P N-terminal domain-containing protein, partial [Actinomycetales bacterium]|nr:aminopeptidase P N-terminal domain-containing protein [Actinomycetales bacterium]
MTAEPTTDSPDGAPTSEQQHLTERGSNRSQRPGSQAFREFIASDWAPRAEPEVLRTEVADHAARRRDRVCARFPGDRLVVPAGPLKVRSNDTDYRFRPHSAFAHLTGLGTDEEPGAVLVLHPEGQGHDAVLYFRPLAGRDTEEFYADSRYGEFWVGARPTLEEIEARTGLRCAHIDELKDALAKDAGKVTLRVVPESDASVEDMVAALRGSTDAEPDATLADATLADATLADATLADATLADATLAEALSELRLVKDEWEVEQLRAA